MPPVNRPAKAQRHAAAPGRASLGHVPAHPRTAVARARRALRAAPASRLTSTAPPHSHKRWPPAGSPPTHPMRGYASRGLVGPQGGHHQPCARSRGTGLLDRYREKAYTLMESCADECTRRIMPEERSSARTTGKTRSRLHIHRLHSRRFRLADAARRLSPRPRSANSSSSSRQCCSSVSQR